MPFNKLLTSIFPDVRCKVVSNVIRVEASKRIIDELSPKLENTRSYHTHFTMNATAYNAAALKAIMPIEYVVKYDDAFNKLLETYETISHLTASESVIIPSDNTYPIREGTDPRWHHQEIALRKTLEYNHFGLFMDMGCVSGKTQVTINRNGGSRIYNIEYLYQKFNSSIPGGIPGAHVWDSNIPTRIRSLNGDVFGLSTILAVLDKGVRPVVQVILESGKKIILTPDHEICTESGEYIATEKLSVGDRVTVNGKSIDKDGYVRVFGRKDHPRNTTGGVYEHILVAEEKYNRPILKNEVIHHINGIKHDNRPENLELLDSQSTHSKIHVDYKNLDDGDGFIIPKYESIISIESVGEQRVYDIVCDDPYHNFVANNIVVHNCGKSRVVVDYVDVKQPQKILIVVPKNVLVGGVWSEQFQRFSITRNGKSDVLELDGSTEDKAHAVKTMATFAKKFIIVMNYEAARAENVAKEIEKAGFDLVVLDEVHRIKSAGSAVSRTLARITKNIPMRLGLTGTPLADKPLDVYGVYRYLDSSIFGTNFEAFRNQYADMGGYMNYSAKAYKNIEEMHRKMYSIAYRVTKDVLDLPEMIEINREFELSPYGRRVYDQLDYDLTVALGDDVYNVTNSLTRILRLQQITSGYLPKILTNTLDPNFVKDVSTDPPIERNSIDDTRRNVLKEILEDLPEHEPVVVYCRFIEDLRVIREVCGELKRGYKELSGRKSEHVEWANGNGTILGVQIASGNAGINLTRASFGIYYSLDYRLVNFEQSKSRMHRPGQKNNVRYVYLVARNTVDEDVLFALKNKKDIVQTIVDKMEHGVNRIVVPEKKKRGRPKKV